ncbi:hypothetical protein FYJ25_05035 [Anaerobutyricum soehngenii]|uniref:Uncharacterized protein n=1 Tax=Anaerobutyricum soehngenii TaxID=105843 RepID=A0A6N7XY35_9FIRM|nr:hypothetical protein [Anaerobutyricum soehngenii]
MRKGQYVKNASYHLILKQPKNRPLEEKESISVTSEQVLNVSAGANIQHAATKVTDMNSFSSRGRLCICLSNELSHIISGHFHKLHLLLLLP